MSEVLREGLKQYKQKYYRNRLLKGGILVIAWLASLWLILSLAEGLGQFGTTTRTLFFFGYVSTALYVLVLWIGLPLSRLLNLQKPISDDQAAIQIGKYFPEVADRLLNTLQLSRLADADNSLIRAAIEQKTSELKLVPFTGAIQYSENRKYLKYALPPLLLLIVGFIVVPQLMRESTARIISYNTKFLPKAPFSMVLVNENLKAYKGEDFSITLEIKGRSIPEEVFLIKNGRKVSLSSTEPNRFTFTFTNLQKTEAFSFEAGGFRTEDYKLEVVARPSLTQFSIQLLYPSYTGKKKETLKNNGNLLVPAGTQVQWEFSATDADSLILNLESEKSKMVAAGQADGQFIISKRLLKSTNYKVDLKNRWGKNKEEIAFQAEVIPDLYPEISMTQFKDTLLLNYLVLGGGIGDDYGLTKLEMQYHITNPEQKSRDIKKSVRIPINKGAQRQNWVYRWSLDSLNLRPSDVLEYGVTVWDNDGVIGPKSTKSQVLTLQVPSEQEARKQTEASAEKTSEQMEGALKESQKLKKEVEKLKERLRGKKQLSFQDKKAMEDLAKKQEELRKEVQQLQAQNQKLNQQQQRFEKPNNEVAQKLEALEKMMNELLDDETKKLYDELQKLLDSKNQKTEDFLQALEKIEKKEKNLNKELDRSLELFKKLRLEQKTTQTIEKLDQLSKQQDELAKATEQKPEDPKADSKGEKELNKKPLDKSEKGEKGQKDDKKGPENKSDKEGSKDKSGDKTKPDSLKQDSAIKKDKSDKGNPDSKSESDKDNNNKPDEVKTEEGKEQSKSDEGPNSELQKEQEELKKAFEEIEKDLEKMEQLNKELENPNKMPDLQEEKEGVKQNQKESQQALKQNKKKLAAQKQKQAAQKMKEMAQEMKESQMQSEKEENEENEADLRKVLENLLTLSFDQEELMKEFKSVSNLDPRFVALSQKQLKLRDDAKIIEDSLDALAKRVFEIKNFVTREMAAMREYMDEASDFIKQRRPREASGKQQLSMTSINNLALLLDESLRKMQENNEQQQMSGSGKPKMKRKSKPKPQPGNMAQLQKELNKRIEQLKKGKEQNGSQGQGSKQLSEELAGLAAQQEALRRALQQLEKMQQQQSGGGKQPSSKLSDLKNLMEKSEQDLVNKRITQETMMRQQEILTRLLEAENAVREREFENKRESKTGKELPRQLPPDIQKYLKEKQAQIELLNTLPPSFTPFYKQETGRYFQQLGGGKN